MRNGRRKREMKEYRKARMRGTDYWKRRREEREGKGGKQRSKEKQKRGIKGVNIREKLID